MLNQLFQKRNEGISVDIKEEEEILIEVTFIKERINCDFTISISEKYIFCPLALPNIKSHISEYILWRSNILVQYELDDFFFCSTTLERPSIFLQIYQRESSHNVSRTLIGVEDEELKQKIISGGDQSEQTEGYFFQEVTDAMHIDDDLADRFVVTHTTKDVLGGMKNKAERSEDIVAHNDDEIDSDIFGDIVKSSTIKKTDFQSFLKSLDSPLHSPVMELSLEYIFVKEKAVHNGIYRFPVDIMLSLSFVKMKNLKAEVERIVKKHSTTLEFPLNECKVLMVPICLSARNSRWSILSICNFKSIDVRSYNYNEFYFMIYFYLEINEK